MTRQRLQIFFNLAQIYKHTLDILHNTSILFSEAIKMLISLFVILSYKHNWGFLTESNFTKADKLIKSKTSLQI